MKCSHCGNESDVNKSLCSHCGQRALSTEQVWVQLMASPASDPVTPLPKTIPSRPRASLAAVQTLNRLPAASSRSQSPLRVRRFLTDSPVQKTAFNTSGIRRVPSALAFSSLAASKEAHDSAYENRALTPGTLLRGGRYCLRELQSYQEWRSGIYEAIWLAQDAQRSGAPVMICELMISNQAVMQTQSLLWASTMALTSIGRHARIPTLWNAFSDQGRSFFVFEPVDGETLLVRMRRTGRALPEQDVIEFCIQVTEILDLLAQQAPPLVHGLIRPEHIFVSRDGTRYMLANFSVIVAGRGTEFIAGMERSRLSAYASPEMTSGIVDLRSDLYSLLATAYHAVTGSMPVVTDGSVPQARRLNLTVSSQFDAILAKGLRSSADERYQHPSELRAELLALQSSAKAVSPGNSLPMSSQRLALSGRPRLSPDAHSTAPGSISQPLPDMLSAVIAYESDVNSLPLPHHKKLSAPDAENELRKLLLWTGGIVLCLIVVMLLIRNFI